jgi:hypothetical protein
LLLAVAVPLSCCLGFLSLLAFLGVMTLGAVIHVIGIARANGPQWPRVEPVKQFGPVSSATGALCERGERGKSPVIWSVRGSRRTCRET